MVCDLLLRRLRISDIDLTVLRCEGLYNSMCGDANLWTDYSHVVLPVQSLQDGSWDLIFQPVAMASYVTGEMQERIAIIL